jgi:hypothetical protein
VSAGKRVPARATQPLRVAHSRPAESYRCEEKCKEANGQAAGDFLPDENGLKPSPHPRVWQPLSRMMPHKGSADGQELARHLPIMVFAIAFSCPAARSPDANISPKLLSSSLGPFYFVRNQSGHSRQSGILRSCNSFVNRQEKRLLARVLRLSHRGLFM